MQRGAVRRERATERPLDLRELPDLASGQQPDLVSAEAPVAPALDLRSPTAQLRRVARNRKVAALVEVAVDALASGDLADSDDGLVHRLLHPDRRCATGLPGDPA